MKQYLDAVKHVLENGEERLDRTGTGTIGVFGYQMRFDLREGFPAVTTKELKWESVVAELLWFLEGSTDERRLAELTHSKPRRLLIDEKTVWTANANKQAKALGYENTDLVKELGPVYGKLWTDFHGVDQIENLINGIKRDPFGRRHIVSAWDASTVHEAALPPCHTMFQFYVSANQELSCQLYQRSCDLPLGAPFNIASYALLTHMVAAECGLGAGDFVYTIGDMHIYLNQIDGIKEQINRDPLPLPTLEMDLDGFSVVPEYTYNLNEKYRFKLKNYRHHSKIVMPMSA